MAFRLSIALCHPKTCLPFDNIDKMFREVFVIYCIIISYKLQVLFAMDLEGVSESIFVQFPFQIA